MKVLESLLVKVLAAVHVLDVHLSLPDIQRRHPLERN